MAFNKGGDAANEAAATQRGGSFAKTHFFNLKDGEQAFLRYITDWDEIIYVKQHQGVPTKAKPAGYEGNWPKAMPTVCRYEDAWEGKYPDCYPCDNTELVNSYGRPLKPTFRNWAIAILREEVIATADMVGAKAGGKEITEAMVGKRIGFRDQTREVERPKRTDKGEIVKGDDDKPVMETVVEPAFVVVNQPSNIYFDNLGAQYSAWKTINDRDYLVRAKGEGTDKNYSHINLDETPLLVPGTEKWEDKYLTPLKEIGLDLETLIADRASDEYYARFIDPNKATPKREGEKGGSSESAPDVPKGDTGEPDEEKLAAMRERLKQGGGAQAPGKAAALADVD